MAKITLSGTGAVTLDGELFQLRSQWTVDVTKVSEQTRDIDTTYVQLKPSGFVFMAIANLGSENAILRLFYSGSSYLRFNIPAGGHILLPGMGKVAGTDVTFVDPSIRTAATTSRIKLIIGVA